MARKKEAKNRADAVDDVIKVPDLKDSDIVIPVMGVTGSGKSNFINVATGQSATPVGDDLVSSTKEVQPVVIPYPGDPNRRVVFVDTPGLNDSRVDNKEILRRVAAWLEHLCEANISIAGIIYLYEISQSRFGTTGKDLLAFEGLYPPGTSQNFIVATTQWKLPPIDAHLKREEQLRAKFCQGLDVVRFVNTFESAWDIANLIMTKDPFDTPQFRDALLNLAEQQPKTPKPGIYRLSSFFRHFFP